MKQAMLLEVSAYGLLKAVGWALDPCSIAPESKSCTNKRHEQNDTWVPSRLKHAVSIQSELWIAHVKES